MHGCKVKVTNELSFAYTKKNARELLQVFFHMDARSIVNLGMQSREHNINLVERLWIPKRRLKDHKLGSIGDL